MCNICLKVVLFSHQIFLLILLPMGLAESDSQPTLTSLPITKKYPVIFEQAGQMAMTNSYLHVLVSFDVVALQNDLNEMMNFISDFGVQRVRSLSTTYGDDDPLVKKFQIELLNHPNRINVITRIQETNKRFLSHLNILPEPSQGAITEDMFVYRPGSDVQTARPKRVPALLSILSSAFGTLWGMFGKPAMSSLLNSLASGKAVKSILMYTRNGAISNSQRALASPGLPVAPLNLVEKYKSTLLEDVNTFSQKYYVNDFYETVAQVAEHLNDRVNQFANVVQMLLLHRMSSDWLNNEQLSQLHHSLTDYGKVQGKYPLTTSKNDYLQLEVSYFRNGRNLMGIVHVPCAKNGRFFTLWKFVPAPLPLPIVKETHKSKPLKDLYQFNKAGHIMDLPNEPEALIIKPQHEYLALGNVDDEHKLLTELELSQCNRVNKVYICDNPNFNRLNLNSSCIGSLYTQSQSGVMKYCDFKRQHFVETVVQTGMGQYYLFSPRKYHAYLTCNEKRVPAVVNYANKIDLVPGCTLKTDEHVLNADEHYKSKEEFFYFDWDYSPIDEPADRVLDRSYLDHGAHELMSPEEIAKVKKVYNEIEHDHHDSFVPDMIEQVMLSVFSCIMAMLAFLSAFLYHKMRQVAQKGMSMDKKMEELATFIRTKAGAPKAAGKAEQVNVKLPKNENNVPPSNRTPPPAASEKIYPNVDCSQKPHFNSNNYNHSAYNNKAPRDIPPKQQFNDDNEPHYGTHFRQDQTYKRY